MATENISAKSKNSCLFEKIVSSKKLREIEFENISSEKILLENSILKTDRVISETIHENVLNVSGEVCSLLKLHKTIHIFGNDTDSMSQIISTLESCSIDIENISNKILKYNSSTSINNNKILKNILSMADLLRTCIREEMYGEVFSIITFRRSLPKYIAELPHLKAVFNEIDHIQDFFITDLIKKLSSDLTLSQCIQIIGYLKQVSGLSAIDTKILFLKCRSICVDSHFANLSMNKEPNRISALNNIMRIHVISSISYYLALFNDGKPMVFMQQSDNNSTLYSWIQNYLEMYLQLIRDILYEQSKSISKDDYEQLIESFAQISFCTTSFSRLSMDIKGSIELIFYHSTVNFYSQFLENAQNDFKTQVEIASTSNIDFKNFEIVYSKTLPPTNILLSFSPIANLYNCFLSVNNAFASFSPTEIATWLSLRLQKVLEFCAEAIMAISKENVRNFFLEAYVFIFLPNVFKIMWESIHKMKSLYLSKDNSQIRYIEFVQDLRNKYHDTVIPNKIETPLSFPHFNARNILSIFQTAFNQTILVQHEYNLMFLFQFCN